MPETRTETINIEEVATVTDKNNQSEWKLLAKPAWSKFAVYFYMAKAVHPSQPPPGPVRCVLQRQGLKQSKRNDPEPHPDYDYYWRITVWDIVPDPNDAGEPEYLEPGDTPRAPERPRAAPSSAPSGGNRGGQRDATGISIERQVAMKEARPATEWLLQMQPTLVLAAMEGEDADETTLTALYRRTLDSIYDHILARIQEVEE